MNYSDLKKLDEKVEILRTIAFHLKSQGKQNENSCRNAKPEYQTNLGNEAYEIYEIITNILK